MLAPQPCRTLQTDLRGEIEAFMTVEDRCFPSCYPSRTAVGVAQLAGPGLRVEIRVVAESGAATE